MVGIRAGWLMEDIQQHRNGLINYDQIHELECYPIVQEIRALIAQCRDYDEMLLHWIREAQHSLKDKDSLWRGTFAVSLALERLCKGPKDDFSIAMVDMGEKLCAKLYEH